MGDGSIYETVIGLEVHAQLLTQTKLFCGDSIVYGAGPNTQVSPITLAHPGTLPVLNKKAVEYAVRMGLACHCTITEHNYFARKNYFYPDLPKGYQVSQHTMPICSGGFIKISTTEGERNIRLNRIHMEEDAGKSIHDLDDDYTSIDYNRAGTALIEIVTEPDLSSGEEAFAYLTEIRKLVRYLGICDGNMEEGSLRCDANISVRKKGEKELGTKVEIKNLNSIRHVKKAIEVESKRLIDILNSGSMVVQQTRGFDAATSTTFAIRDKEDADDYRYFPEPDVAPFVISEEFIDRVRAHIPELSAQRSKRYEEKFGLSAYDASLLAEDRAFSDFFEAAIKNTGHYKRIANWMLGPIRSWLNEHEKEITALPIRPHTLVSLVSLIDQGKISFSTAASKLFPQMLLQPETDPEALAVKLNLIQQSDTIAITQLIDHVLSKLPGKVAEYKKGKKGLLSLFVGEVMKQSKGQADPKLTNQILLEKLKT